MSQGGKGEPGPRRMPVQQRSRIRMQRLLDVAREIILEQGSDALRMSDVAQRAGVSIGSLYQYFPDKTSLIATLAQAFYDDSRDCVVAAIADVAAPSAFANAVRSLTRDYYRLFQADPAMLDIWSGMQADKVLRDLDAQENAEVAHLIGQALQRSDAGIDATTATRRSMVLTTMMASTVMLAISLPATEASAILDEFDSLIGRSLAG